MESTPVSGTVPVSPGVSPSLSESRRARRLARVEEHVRYENAHDFEHLMSTFGSSGFYDDEPWGEHNEGLPGVRRYYADLLRAAPDFHIEIKRRHVTEDSVVLEVQLSGTHLGKWRGLPPTGRRIDLPLCAVFTFDEDDHLAGERVYYDRATVLRQLGVLSEPNSLMGRLAALLMHPINVLRALLGFGRRRAGAP